jgi:hypothetical protein
MTLSDAKQTRRCDTIMPVIFYENAFAAYGALISRLFQQPFKSRK